MTEQSRLYTPCPVPWNKVPVMMPKAAGRKQRLMMRRAGIPMASISVDASNIRSSCFGRA